MRGCHHEKTLSALQTLPKIMTYVAPENLLVRFIKLYEVRLWPNVFKELLICR